MQSRLVNDRAREDGFSIVHQSDGQPIKPLRPFTVKMPLDDDLVDLLSNLFAFHSCAPCSPSCSLTVKGTTCRSHSAHSSLVSGSSNDLLRVVMRKVTPLVRGAPSRERCLASR